MSDFIRSSADAKPLIIDCDPGMGERFADVDDNLALLLALAASEVDLLGVTVTFGNTALDTGMRCARTSLDVAGADIPLLPGARNADACGQATAASDYLIETVRARPGQVHLLTLGPVTNVATALQHAPDIADRLASITLMGGAFWFPWFGQRGDPNFHWDAAAAYAVLRTPMSAGKTLITMDVCTAARFTRIEQRRCAEHGSAVGRHIAEGVDHWLGLHCRVPGLRGFFPWDVVALAHVIAPELFQPRTLCLRMTQRGWRAAHLRQVPVSRANLPPLAVPYRLDGTGFNTLMMDRLAPATERVRS